MDTKNFIYSVNDEGVATLTFDLNGENANILREEFMVQLNNKFDEILANPPKLLLFKSAKKSIYIAGADINEIKDIKKEEDANKKIELGQDVISKVGRFSCPTIAVINGACLGGGLEFVLACDYRICYDHKVKLGLPEVKLGIIPGFGGTQRLMRLIGFTHALKMVTSGNMINGEKAYKLGLVDYIYPQAYEEACLKAFIKKIKDEKVRKRRQSFLRGFFEKTSFLRQMLVKYVDKEIRKKTKGFYEAPLVALDVMHRTFNMSLEDGLEEERKAFAKLVISPVSKSLINIYIINEFVKKINSSKSALEISSTGVVGAGIMGGGIAWLFSNRNFLVRLKDVAWEPITKGMQQIAKNYAYFIKTKKMTKNDLDNKLAKVNYSLDFDGFKYLDFVIEAVPEDMELKKKVLAEIENHLPSSAILATNTSSLSVDEMAEALKRANNFVGMHFFNPVNRMPLVEIIASEKTSDKTIQTTIRLATRCGKIPIVVKNSPGFVVNRILMPYINEAGFLLEEGNSAEDIDYSLTKFGMPMGGLTLLDEVGLDVGYKVCKVLNEAFGERMSICSLFENLFVEKKLLGKKAKLGVYHYDEKGKQAGFNDGIKMCIKGNKTCSEDEIVNRSILVMINEASRCLEEKIVNSVEELDLAMIMGIGFPPFKGGLLYYADTLGIEDVYNKLTNLEKNYGERFKPSLMIEELYKNKKSFYTH